MPRRRRLARGLSELAAGAGDVAGLFLQSKLIRERQEQARQDMTLQAILNNLLTQQGARIKRVSGGELAPEQAAAEHEAEVSMLGPKFKGQFPTPTFQGLEPKPEVRLAPLTEDIRKAEKVEQVPSAGNIRLRSLAARVPPEVPALSTDVAAQQAGIGIHPGGAPLESSLVKQLLGEAETQRGSLLAREARTPQTEIVGGVEMQRDLTERERAAQGEQFKIGRQTKLSPQEEAGAAGLKRGAEKRAELDPDIIAAEVKAAGAKKRAEIQAELSVTGFTSQQQQAILSLGDDFDNASKDFYVVDKSFKRLAGLAKRQSGLAEGQKSPVSDIGLVFSLMKMFDPPSTIREGEQAQARDATNVPARFLNLYNRLWATGETLNEAQRADILDTAKSMYTAAVEDQKGVIADYTARADGLRVPAAYVVRQLVAPEATGLDKLRAGQPRP